MLSTSWCVVTLIRILRGVAQYRNIKVNAIFHTLFSDTCHKSGVLEAAFFYTVEVERMQGRWWAQTNGQSGKREETLPMGQPRREDISPMGQWGESTGKIHIGPSGLPPLYSDKIFKYSHYFTLGYSTEMPARKPQNVYMLDCTQFWCIDSYIKISSSH